MVGSFRWMVFELLLAASLLPAENAIHAAGYQERFEAADASWRVVAHDVRHQVLAHARTDSLGRDESRCEIFRLNAANGTHLHVAQDIGQALVNEGIAPSLWIKSDRPGLELRARVVFPGEIDQATGTPLVAYIRGDQYDDVGRWQQLRIGDVQLLVQRQQRVLRLAHQRDINVDGAFLDQLLINAYGGPGITTLYIDDLSIDGYLDRRLVEQSRDSVPSRADHAGNLTAVRQAPRTVERRGEMLLVNGEPFVARSVQRRGESMATIQKHGFNSAWISDAPSWDLLQSAGRAKVAVVCPPPPLPHGEGQLLLAGMKADFANAAFEPVLAWHVHREAPERVGGDIIRHCGLLRDATATAMRPLLGESALDLRATAEASDLVVLQAPPVNGRHDLQHLDHWLSARRPLLQPGNGKWLHVPTETPAALARQLAAIQSPQAGTPLVTAEKMRHYVRKGVIHGFRGFRFGSRTPLEAQSSTYRSQAIRLANLEIELLEPWIAAGMPAGTPVCSVPDVETVALRLDHALLVVAASAKDESDHMTSGSLTVQGVPASYKAYEVTPVGFRPLSSRRAAGGVRVAVKDFDPLSLFVFCEHPHVVKGLASFLSRNAAEAAILQRNLLFEEYQAARNVALRVEQFPENSTLTRCANQLAVCDRLLTAGSFWDAYKAARLAARMINVVREKELRRALDALGSESQIATALSFESLPEFWSSGGTFVSRWPEASSVSGGHMESISELQSAGWRHWHEKGMPLVTYAEIANNDAVSGRSSLHLAVRPPNESNALPLVIESPPLWIQTPAIEVEAGDRVKLHGWIKLTQPVERATENVLIFDSMCGPELAMHIEPGPQWREFTVGRVAERKTRYSATVALAGIGEVWLDDVTIQVQKPSGAALARATDQRPPLPPLR